MEFVWDFLKNVIYALPGIVIALSFHEWGHAYAAYKMGDPTARNFGRMTLNPLAHIDPIGLIMLFLAGFGWAKPVPVNPSRYKNYRKGEIVVSLAGVTMNLILALAGMIVLSTTIKLLGYQRILMSGALQTVLMVLYSFVRLNIGLIVFNLLPIYPLDGFHVAEVTLSKYIGPKPFLWLRKYGQFLLLGILLAGRYWFSPIAFVADWLYSQLSALFALLFNTPLISLLFGV